MNSGDGQIDTVLATLVSPFRVLVSRGNAPAQNVTVLWRALGDSSSPTVTTFTNASGIAEFRKTLGQWAGAYHSEASVADAIGSPVTFTATANPGKPTLRYVSGNNQSDTSNARLGADYTVRVTDSHDNAIAGVVIDWAVTAGGGSITPTRSTTQAGSGYASARHTLGPNDGAQTVTATAGGLPGAPQQTFTATALAVGSLQVTAATTGVDLAPNGYTVVAQRPAQGGKYASVPTNGTATISGLPAGDYSVTLAGVPPNCEVAGPNPRTVSVPSGGTAAVTFDVACVLAAQLAVALSGNIYAVKSNGDGLALLTANASSPAWSPDGSRIAFWSLRDGNRDIYVANADGTNPMRLTNDPGNDFAPAWSPDGMKIAFTNPRDGYWDIYVMNADGTSPVRLTTDHATHDFDPAWSPDGTKIAFASTRDNGGIFVMNADGSGVTRVTTSGSQPHWSPDGTKLVFSRFTECDYWWTFCDYDLFVMNADGSDAARLNTGWSDGDPAWSPDGRWIAFTASFCDSYGGYTGGCLSSHSEVWLVRADGTRLVQLLTNALYPAWRP